MSHRDLTGISPRFHVALSLSDTLLCLGMKPTRSKTPSSHVITAGPFVIEVFTPYKITVTRGKDKLQKFSGPGAVKRELLSQCNI
jgi:hypothetical protein